jgi:hypothetical protein
MTIIEAHRKYKSIGFATHPTKADKSPMSRERWNEGFNEDAFIDAVGIGIVCGKISGGLECIDVDNHFGDAKQILNDYMAIPDVKAIYEKHNFPIEISLRGGYHLIYKCNTTSGNRKLAQRQGANGKVEALIETRGEGGYYCGFPTPGYSVLRNDVFVIPTISVIERAILLDTACAFNEFTTNYSYSQQESGDASDDRPGDLYNRNSDIGQVTTDLLKSYGWQHIGGHRWRRPDKDEGMSATFGKVAENIFYCFTSSGHPFEPNRAYTPFQVLALLKFNGDFKEAAKSIAPETPKPKNSTKHLNVSEVENILNKARIDTSIKVERPPVILSIRERSATQFIYKRLCTLGNFSCIIGKAKSRKTFLLSLLTASILNPTANDHFTSDCPNGKDGVLYFDTEQGEYDCYNVIKRIETMSGSTKMKSFGLREYSPIERCQIIEHAFKIWGYKTAFCVIDGIADLATAINDEEEATRVTTMLLRLTKEYNCHVATIIHQNKNDNFATGHRGSSIMKKAELLMSVTKARDSKELSDVNCDLSRGVDFEAFCFTVNESGIPVISENHVPKKIEPFVPSFNGDFDVKQSDKIAPF